MPASKAPGVYTEEFSQPPSITSVETAIPVFIGYTEKAQKAQPGDLAFVPVRIESVAEYEQFFGLAPYEHSIGVIIDATQSPIAKASASVHSPAPFLVYYSLQLYFANGGGPCYIVSAGNYTNNGLIDKTVLSNGLNAIKQFNEITLIVFPDAIRLPSADLYYSLYKEALQLCADQPCRFTIMDVWMDNDLSIDNIQTLRKSDLGSSSVLQYGAAYYPLLNTTLNYRYNEEDVLINARGDTSLSGTLASLKTKNNLCYQQAVAAIEDIPLVLPVAPAAAGIYATTDNNHGVWKAPANININSVNSPVAVLTDAQQQVLNIDPDTGRSVNAIRSFPGRGNAIVWGARTLAGNDNEWRYISVRRFVSMIETSVRAGAAAFVFEPNDANVWANIKTMIQNYLTEQWKAGALAGDSTKEAFFIHAGPGETMTAQDISEGNLIVEIGLAVLKAAEFIIIRFTQKMQGA